MAVRINVKVISEVHQISHVSVEFEMETEARHGWYMDKRVENEPSYLTTSSPGFSA